MFVIDSAATSREEIGNPPHRGTVNKLRALGIPLVPHRARQVTLDDYDKFDYIIGMDLSLIHSLNRAIRDKLELFNQRLFQKKEGSRRSLFLERCV